MKRWITKACITLFATILVTLLAFAEESNIFVGTGTAEDPYQISTAQELRFLAERINAGDEVYNTAHYRLTKDMDLERKTFTPIGVDLDHAFRGNFDGEGHIISGLQTEIIEGYPYYGLFGVLDGGEVRNVTVVGYISGSPVSGGIVGLNHGGKVVNCMANCWVSASHSDHVGRQVIGTAGGIVGINEAGGLVANSCYTNFYHDACVYGEGIVHTNREDSRVVNCFSSGETVQFHHEGEFENSYLRYDPESLPEEREDLVWYFSAYFTDESGKLTPVNRLVGEEVKKESIFGGETTLLGALNAWIDAQGSDKYCHWTQFPGQYPIIGDHLIFCDTQVGEYLPWGKTEPFVLIPGEESTWAPAKVQPNVDGVSRTIWLRPEGDYHRLLDVIVDGENIGYTESVTLPADGGTHKVTARYVIAVSLDNYKLDTPYNGYIDVDEDAWYGINQEGAIRDVTMLGLFNGDEKGNFAPLGSLSVAEAIKLAAVIRNTYWGNPHVFDQTAGEHWYDCYVEYAFQHNIMWEGQFEDYERPATRREMATLFIGVVPELEMISILIPPDVEESDDGYSGICQLYGGGILRGGDELGTFHPDEPITRAEVAAIAVRVALPEKRISTQ